MAVIRKCGHLAEYGVLAVLCWRAVRRRPGSAASGWRGRDAFLAVGLAVLYAVSDEVHQAFVPSRTATPWDVVIDACGAAAAIAITWAIGRAVTGRSSPPAP
jgi:VanZ family protein